MSIGLADVTMYKSSMYSVAYRITTTATIKSPYISPVVESKHDTITPFREINDKYWFKKVHFKL